MTPLSKAVWPTVGWYCFLPKAAAGLPQANWVYVCNVGGDLGDWFRAYHQGGYYDAEDFGDGQWSSATFPIFPSKS